MGAFSLPPVLMLTRLAAVLLVCFVAFTFASDCTRDHRYASSSESGHFGCDSYASMVDISWLIQLPDDDADKRILLEFDSFDTEAGYDFLAVYDGTSATAPLMGRSAGTTIPGPYTSRSNAIFIEFRSDEYVQGSGFSAHWSSFSFGGNVAPCDHSEHIELTGADGSFGCNGYTHRLEDSWHITGNAGERLVLSFNTFDTERDYDFVKVYDGADAGAQLVGTFSGPDLPPPVTSTGHELYVTLTSDYSLEGDGFTASWNSLVSVADPCYNNTNQVLLTPQGYLGCPYGYGNNVNSTWLISIAGDFRVQLDFLTLNLESNADFIDVYDGPNRQASKIGTFTGMQTPSPIRSSGNDLFVVLRTDNHGTAGGFSATYESVHGLQSGGCSSNGQYVKTAAQDSVGCNGYESGVVEEWQLVAQSVNESISITWNTFDTESSHDIVYVYDGQDANARLVGSYSGNELPEPFVSSTQYLFVKFVADNDHIQGSGFSAIYQSVARLADPTSCQASHDNLLTAQEGTFGCDSYANSVTVTWQIHVQDGFKILLDWNTFATETGYDTVSVYDGPNAAYNLLGTFSGVRRPPELTSSSNYLFVTFVSDEGVVRAGFSVDYSSIYSGSDAASCFESADHTLSQDEAGTFGCSGYGPNVRVTWAVSTPANTVIIMDFTHFQTEFNYDFVTVYDGTNDQGTVLAHYSGYTIPDPVRTSSNRAFIVFTSDDAVNYDGFTVSYHAAEDAAVGIPACTASTSQVLTEPTGEFGCSGYTNSLNSNWLIQEAEGTTITLRLTSVDTEQFYDVVKIFDGPTSAANSLGTYSGKITEPIALTTTGNKAYVTFVSDSSVSTGEGFHIEYVTYQVHGGDDDDSGELAKCSQSTNHTLTDSSGEFGCDGYNGNVVVTWSISSFANIMLNFRNFNTEPTYDYVTVYDGDSETAPILTTLSGSLSEDPPRITSTGHSLFVKFVSDASINRSGFTAQYITAIRHPHTE